MTQPDQDIGSLWQASARVDEPATVPLEGNARADIVIVGAGFTGLSVALHAAETGRSVIVLESGGIGFGASGRNGGQVNPGLKIDGQTLQRRYGEAGLGLHRAGQSAPDYLDHLVTRHGLRCGWRRPGLYRLAHNDTALAAIRAAAASLRSEGIATEDLSAHDVERRVGTRRYVGGFYDPRGGAVHPLELARELARAAIAAGAAIHTRSPVTGLTRDHVGWRVDTATGVVAARTVVVATNAYSDDLVPGLERTILPVNSFQIATAPLDPRHQDTLPGGETVYDSRRLVLYFRRSPDNRLLMGGRSSFSSSRVAGRDAPDYAVLKKVVHDAFPRLADVAVEYRWTGLVGITWDYLPHYHVPEEGLHVLLGFNGRGVALSVRLGAWLGRKLAEAPEDFTIPQTPIRPFPLHRFREPVLNLGMRWNHLLDLVGR